MQIIVYKICGIERLKPYTVLNFQPFYFRSTLTYLHREKSRVGDYLARGGCKFRGQVGTDALDD